MLFVPAGGTRWIALNTTIPPTDNINIRKAIIASSNRDALRLTRGGKVLGDIATGWIPPGIPGFEESGGLKQNTDLDYLAHPAGDPAIAKKYMLAAKEQDPSLPIDSNGKWTGSEKILTIATNADPGKKTAEVFQNQMEQLGFKLNFRIVPQDTLYTKFSACPSRRSCSARTSAGSRTSSTRSPCSTPRSTAKNILPQGNVNWSQLNDPGYQQRHEGGGAEPIGPAA